MQSMKRAAALILSTVLCMVLLTGCKTYEVEPELSTYFHIDTERPYTTALTPSPVISSSYASRYAVLPDGVYEDRPFSSAILCVNNTTNEVVSASNPFAKIYPASITKIMTALLVLERGTLTDTVVIEEEIQLGDAQAVAIGLQPGDTITVQELLHGLLIASANDCAVALARYISGSEEAFVALMNERAQELGATHTHFMNPHGLQDPEHYTTAYDLYLIFQKLITHAEFQEITGLPSYTMQYTNGAGEPVALTLTNSDRFVSESYPLADGIQVIAGKTGTTNEAGYCLLVEAKDAAGQDYIALVCGAPYRDSLYYQMQQLLNQLVTSETDTSESTE